MREQVSDSRGPLSAARSLLPVKARVPDGRCDLIAMPELQVKKVVAICFLEAAKQTLEHLGTHRLELSQQGVPGPEELPRLYGDVRRLRDYLQRCASAYDESVDLDLADADASLLVACCRRAVESIDHRLVERALAEQERNWLQKKRTVLADWAVELAAKPLLELPLPKISPIKSEAVRALDTRLQNKVFGDVSQRQKIFAPGQGQPAAPGSIAQGIASFGETMANTPVALTPSEEISTDALPPIAGGEQQVEPDREVPVSPPILDRRRIKDPRLRSLVGVDMAAMDRCLADGDHRLASVLLASVLESAVLDHAIPRRSELGLTGTPDTWQPQDLLLKAMGDLTQPKDRSLAFHLFASRNLLRPSLQMVTPAVVTEASFDRLREFVSRALHALGFGSAAQTLPPGSVHAEDLQ